MYSSKIASRLHRLGGESSVAKIFRVLLLAAGLRLSSDCSSDTVVGGPSSRPSSRFSDCTWMIWTLYTWSSHPIPTSSKRPARDIDDILDVFMMIWRDAQVWSDGRNAVSSYQRVTFESYPCVPISPIPGPYESLVLSPSFHSDAFSTSSSTLR